MCCKIGETTWQFLYFFASFWFSGCVSKIWFQYCLIFFKLLSCSASQFLTLKNLVFVSCRRFYWQQGLQQLQAQAKNFRQPFYCWKWTENGKIGILESTTATAASSSLLKLIRTFSNFVTLIPIRLKSQIQENFLELISWRSHLSLESREKSSSSLVNVLHKKWN